MPECSIMQKHKTPFNKHSTIFAKKQFGQNFLHDDYVISKIIANVKLQDNQSVIEIGPGKGALTQSLICKSKVLDVIEIDRDLVAYLSNKFQQDLLQGNLVIHNADALKFDFASVLNNSKITTQSIFIVGNLPYNISTELLFYLSNFPQITQALFMLQKEVVERICAQTASTNYSRLSVGLQHKYHCEKLFEVSRECFYPIPQVESAILKLTRKNDILPVNEKLFHQIVGIAFNQRRKCLRNSLKNLIDFNRAEFSKYAVMRPQELSVADFVTLTNFITTNLCQH